MDRFPPLGFPLKRFSAYGYPLPHRPQSRRPLIRVGGLMPILLAVLFPITFASCSTINISPGVNFYGTDLGIERKSDGAEAVYASDLIKGEFTFYVVSEDFPFAEDAAGIGGIHDTWGVNIVYQAPTRFRSRQNDGVEPTVEGEASYLAVFLVDKFSTGNRASQILSSVADRMFFGLGMGRISITGEADFNTSDPATTPIDAVDNSAFVFLMGFETQNFLGVENLIFRGTLAEYIFENDEYEFLVGGVVFTIGYRFGIDFSRKPPEQ